MPNDDNTRQNKAKKAQKPSTIQYVCQPAALSTACQQETYEGSPSPYNTTAEDDSVAVTVRSGQPPGQHMMSTAVSWDHGAAYTASPDYVNQQPGPHQQQMKYQAPYYQESYTGTQGGSGVVYQQPGPNAPMGSGYCGYPGGEGQPPPSQQHGYPQQGSQPHNSQQYGSQPYGSQPYGSQQYGHGQDGYNGGGGSSG